MTAVKGTITDVEKHISKFPNVCAVCDITGLTDMLVITKFKNRKELRFHEIETCIRSNLVPKDLVPFCPEE